MPICCTITPNQGVVSLLEMLRFNAQAFISYFQIIHQIELTTKTGSKMVPSHMALEEHKFSVLGNVFAYEAVCRQHGLMSAAAKCNRIVESLKGQNKQITYGELNQWMVDLRERFEDDLVNEVFLHLRPDQAKLYLEIPPEWKPILERFPNTKNDVEECHKCFALERNAASIFHILLVAEFGVIEVAKLLGVAGDKPGWGSLDRLQKVSDKQWTAKSDLEKKYDDLLKKTLPLMLSIKNEWRHKISHVDNKLEWLDTDFSPDVAWRIIIATQGFLANLAVDLPK